MARTLHAPVLIDAEVSSVVRGLAIARRQNVQITARRAVEMLTDDAKLAATLGHNADIHVYTDGAAVE